MGNINKNRQSGPPRLAVVLGREAGQTLIETIVAIFILTMALTSGLALTIYAFASAAVSQNEIVASNLAQEGIEVIRMMRDSNWLAGDAAGGIYALQPCADIGNTYCYPAAFVGPTYTFAPFGNERVLFNSATSVWTMDSTASYNLYLQPDGTYTNNTVGNSIYARMINITLNSSAPYTGPNPELIVKSVVAWRGKKCTAFNTNQDLVALSTTCKIIVEEHLTNWKDYQ